MSSDHDDVARHYESGYGRVRALMSTLSADEAATPVPATPPWTVHDVLAHLVALPTDAFAGRLKGLPTDEFTAGQVAERKDRSIDELLAEWDPNVPQLLEGARAGLVPAALAMDVLTHEQDMLGALGRQRAITDEQLRFCTTRFAMGCGFGFTKSGIQALRIEATDTDFAVTAGEGDPVATVRAPEFELFRALAGRRSRGQVEAFAWQGDPAAYVEKFNIFGPLPAMDVVD